jgi:hypothetical protein
MVLVGSGQQATRVTFVINKHPLLTESAAQEQKV